MTPAVVIDELVSIMHDLEERAPGVSFAVMLSALNPDEDSDVGITAAANVLRSRGYSESDIKELLGDRYNAAKAPKRSAEDDAPILALRKEGLNATQIAEYIGASAKTVQRVLARHGLSVKPGTQKKATVLAA